MAEVQKRMALTLSTELREALFDLADATGKPAATVAADLLQEMVPQLRDLAKVMRAVKSGRQDAAKRALAHMVGNGMAELMTASQPELFKPAKKGRG
jgi:predicted DNA-binding protein